MFMRFRGGGVGHKATRHINHALAQDTYETIREDTIVIPSRTANLPSAGVERAENGSEEDEDEDEDEEDDSDGEDEEEGDVQELEVDEDGLDPIEDDGYAAL
jgi:hypothetical protein